MIPKHTNCRYLLQCFILTNQVLQGRVTEVWLTLTLQYISLVPTMKESFSRAEGEIILPLLGANSGY